MSSRGEVDAGNLFIVSAPSGAGKTSLVKALLGKPDVGLVLSISSTTRVARPGEQDGVDYNFLSKEQFQDMVAQGGFLEHAEVFGNFYGTSQASVAELRAKGLDVILEIDWQGAQQVRKMVPDCISVFILPPSKQALADRLHSRKQDSAEVIAGRLSEAAGDMGHFDEFDYLVINDDFDVALEDMWSVIRAQRLLLKVQKRRNVAVLKELLD